jgi:hypothetical protein
VRSQTHFWFGRLRAEVALQQVARLLDRGLAGDRGALLRAAQLAFDPVLAHHAGDLVAADCRRNSFQVFRAPYARRQPPRAASISTSNSWSASSRADGFRDLRA